MAGLPEEGIAFDGFGFKRDAAGFSQTDNEADLPLGCGNIATKVCAYEQLLMYYLINDKLPYFVSLSLFVPF